MQNFYTHIYPTNKIKENTFVQGYHLSVHVSIYFIKLMFTLGRFIWKCRCSIMRRAQKNVWNDLMKHFFQYQYHCQQMWFPYMLKFSLRRIPKLFLFSCWFTNHTLHIWNIFEKKTKFLWKYVSSSFLHTFPKRNNILFLFIILQLENSTISYILGIMYCYIVCNILIIFKYRKKIQITVW